MTRPSRSLPALLSHLGAHSLPMVCFPRVSVAARCLLVLLALVTLGCHRDEIASYSIPKQSQVDEQNVVVPDELKNAGGPDRMLAAILLYDDDGWFFKLTGPREPVGSQADSFRDFLASIRFANSGSIASTPEWDLPEGWTSSVAGETAAGGFATIEVPNANGDSLKLTVSRLPTSSWTEAEYKLANINRWRKQIGLPEMGRAHLTALTERIETADGEATLVDLTGTLSSTGGMPPFAGMSGGGNAPFAGGAAPRRDPAANESVSMKYDRPEGWQDAPLSASRGGITLNYAAAFKVGEPGRQVDITVSEFPATGNEMLRMNVNRWRQQVGLPPASDAGIADSLESISLANQEAKYIELVPESDGTDMILGAIAEAKGRTWFFKLIGDRATAERERQHFREFVQSARFE